MRGGGSGATKQEGGGQGKFYPYKKRGVGSKRFSYAEEGHKKYQGSFDVGHLSF